ncbi:hypothetical protein OG607_32425 [Streptomyces sp. NBC_01537]
MVPAARPQPSPEAGPGLSSPSQLHRGMTLLGVISLFIGTRGVWTAAMGAFPPIAAVISVAYAAILATGVLALSVRGRAALARVDLAVLLTGIVLALCGFAMSHSASDEGVLTAQAAHEILHGRPIYGQPWPWLFQDGHVAITQTMSGGVDYTYGYPPLVPLLTAPVYAVVGSALAATMVSTGALLAGTVLLWFKVPVAWRSAVTAVCLGFGLLPQYARIGYPAMTAFALLVPVVVGWPSIGAGGRLGRPGLLRAACLGAACAAQQLPWFLTPFLLVGLYAVRRGELGPVRSILPGSATPGAAPRGVAETPAGNHPADAPAPCDAPHQTPRPVRPRSTGQTLGHRQALALVARFLGTAAATWLAINAYFIVQAPHAWLEGVALPLTQGAFIHGQGIVGISYYFTHGSSRLAFYSYASMLLLCGLLALFAVFIRRLGPAAAVLPWCVFYFATRSQDGYYVMMTPLWLAAAATAPTAAFATAWRPRPPLRSWSRLPVRAALAAGLLAPSFLCVGVAAASPPPLRMRITAEHLHGTAPQALTLLAVDVTNPTDSVLTPHFVVSIGQGTSAFWKVRSGPSGIAAHGTAHYVLLPPEGPFKLPRQARKHVRLRAFTPEPATLTSIEIPHAGVR